MKDRIVSLIRIIIWSSLLWYMSFFYIKSIHVVASQNPMINNGVIIFLWLLAIWMIYMWVRPFYIKRFKTLQVILGIFLVMFAHSVLKDDPYRLVFIQDALKVLWVFMIIIWPTWFCISEKVKKKIEEAKIEIIEV